MKNSALILLLVAIVAIAAVVYFIFMKSPKYTAWRSFSQPYRTRASYEWCQCANGSRCRQTSGGSCTCCSGMDYEILK